MARRFFAPQRVAFEKSPEGLPFFRTPSRFSWGVTAIFSTLVPTKNSVLIEQVEFERLSR
jgi:hypothetical protein